MSDSPQPDKNLRQRRFAAQGFTPRTLALRVLATLAVPCTLYFARSLLIPVVVALQSGDSGTKL